MSSEEKITFKCSPELADRLRKLAFQLDTTASDLIRTSIIAGLPIVSDLPHLFFGVQYAPRSKDGQSES